MVEPYVGEVRLMGFGFNPRDWRLCDGQSYPIGGEYLDLFKLIGRTYGGNDTTFNVPDLRGATAVHGRGDQIGPEVGQRGGVATVTLTSNEVPGPHSHAPQGSNQPGDQAVPNGNVLAGGGTHKLYAAAVDPANQITLNPRSVQQIGGNQPHENMAPYLPVTFCIAVRGIIPPRPEGGDA